jgi:hypothetical protein
VTTTAAAHEQGDAPAERIRRCSRVPPQFRRDLVFATALHGHELGVFRAYG